MAMTLQGGAVRAPALAARAAVATKRVSAKAPLTRAATRGMRVNCARFEPEVHVLNESDLDRTVQFSLRESFAANEVPMIVGSHDILGDWEESRGAMMKCISNEPSDPLWMVYVTLPSYETIEYKVVLREVHDITARYEWSRGKNLKLEAKEGSPPAPSGTNYVIFRMHAEMEFGDRVLIVGAAPELGNWSIKGALELAWSNGDIWVGKTTSGAGTEFKVVRITASGEEQWQNSNNLVIGDAKVFGAEVWSEGNRIAVEYSDELTNDAENAYLAAELSKRAASLGMNGGENEMVMLRAELKATRARAAYAENPEEAIRRIKEIELLLTGSVAGHSGSSYNLAGMSEDDVMMLRCELKSARATASLADDPAEAKRKIAELEAKLGAAASSTTAPPAPADSIFPAKYDPSNPNAGSSPFNTSSPFATDSPFAGIAAASSSPTAPATSPFVSSAPAAPAAQPPASPFGGSTFGSVDSSTVVRTVRPTQPTTAKIFPDEFAKHTERKATPMAPTTRKIFPDEFEAKVERKATPTAPATHNIFPPKYEVGGGGSDLGASAFDSGASWASPKESYTPPPAANFGSAPSSGAASYLDHPEPTATSAFATSPAVASAFGASSVVAGDSGASGLSVTAKPTAPTTANIFPDEYAKTVERTATPTAPATHSIFPPKYDVGGGGSDVGASAFGSGAANFGGPGSPPAGLYQADMENAFRASSVAADSGASGLSVTAKPTAPTTANIFPDEYAKTVERTATPTAPATHNIFPPKYEVGGGGGSNFGASAFDSGANFASSPPAGVHQPTTLDLGDMSETEKALLRAELKSAKATLTLADNPAAAQARIDALERIIMTV